MINSKQLFVYIGQEFPLTAILGKIKGWKLRLSIRFSHKYFESKFERVLNVQTFQSIISHTFIKHIKKEN